MTKWAFVFLLQLPSVGSLPSLESSCGVFFTDLLWSSKVILDYYYLNMPLLNPDHSHSRILLFAAAGTQSLRSICSRIWLLQHVGQIKCKLGKRLSFCGLINSRVCRNLMKTHSWKTILSFQNSNTLRRKLCNVLMCTSHVREVIANIQHNQICNVELYP